MTFSWLFDFGLALAYTWDILGHSSPDKKSEPLSWICGEVSWHDGCGQCWPRDEDQWFESQWIFCVERDALLTDSADFLSFDFGIQFDWNPQRRFASLCYCKFCRQSVLHCYGTSSFPWRQAHSLRQGFALNHGSGCSLQHSDIDLTRLCVFSSDRLLDRPSTTLSASMK